MSERILLVEDEALVADMVRLNLEHAGFRVDAVTTGSEGLERLASHAYDLALLDVMLPGIDGFEIARRARAAGVLTPVLMLTARAWVNQRVAGLDAGADDYLVKPFDRAELLSAWGASRTAACNR